MDKQTPSPSSLPTKKPKLTSIYDVLLAYKWPVLIVMLVIFLRTPIGLAISQITHGELSWGKDNGLKVLIDKLASSTSEITSTPISSTIPDPDKNTVLLNTNDLQAIVSSVIEEAAKSPRVALLKTGFELEKKAQEILFASNWGGGRADFTLGQSIDKLIELGQIPPFATGSFQLFNTVRSQVIHGGNSAIDQDLISAIDSGIVLLRVLYAIPVEENIVYNPGVIIYADAECKNEIKMLVD